MTQSQDEQAAVDAPVEYTEQDFKGLYKFLKEETCSGVDLLTCEITVDPDVDIKSYLNRVDECLYTSHCLNYHQILTYRNKLKYGDTGPRENVQPHFEPMQEEKILSTLDDLQLAEINYLCIKASITGKTEEARLNTMEHCSDHLIDLFEAG